MMVKNLEEKNKELEEIKKKSKILEDKLENLHTNNDFKEKAREIIAEDIMNFVQKSDRFDHLSKSLESCNIKENLKSPIVYLLVIGLSCAIITPGMFIFELIYSQLTCILIKDHRSIKWASEFPQVLLWCISLCSRIGVTAYTTLLRGFGNRGRDKFENWGFLGKLMNLILPCTDTIKSWSPGTYSNSINEELLSKILEIMKKNGKNIKNLIIQCDCTDILAGLTINKTSGTIWGLHNRIMKVSEWKTFYEKNKDKIDEMIATKAFQILIQAEDGTYSCLISNYFLKGEDTKSIASCIDKTIETIQKYGGDVKYICSDGAAAYQNYKSSNLQIIGFTCIIHMIKNAISFLYEHICLVCIYFKSLPLFEKKVNKMDSIGYKIELEDLRFNVITLIIPKEVSGLLTVSWTDKTNNVINQYSSTGIIHNEIWNCNKPNNWQNDPYLSYFIKNDKIHITVNSNYTKGFKQNFQWTLFSDKELIMKVEIMLQCIQLVSLDIFKNQWKTKFSKLVPWNAVAHRDKQSEYESVAFFKDECLTILKDNNSQKGLFDCLYHLSNLYSIIKKDLNNTQLIEKQIEAYTFFLEQQNYFETNGMNNQFSSEFYTSCKMNLESFKCLKGNDNISLKNVSTDYKIEGSFGVARSFKGSFDAYQYQSLTNLMGMETYKMFDPNTPYAYPTRIGKPHYEVENAINKEKKEEEINQIKVSKQLLELFKNKMKNIVDNFNLKDFEEAKEQISEYNPTLCMSIRNTFHKHKWNSKLKKNELIIDRYTPLSFTISDKEVKITSPILNNVINEGDTIKKGTMKSLDKKCVFKGDKRCNLSSKKGCLFQFCKKHCTDVTCVAHFTEKRKLSENLK
jgi:hypothetical protein